MVTFFTGLNKGVELIGVIREFISLQDHQLPATRNDSRLPFYGLIGKFA